MWNFKKGMAFGTLAGEKFRLGELNSPTAVLHFRTPWHPGTEVPVGWWPREV